MINRLGGDKEKGRQQDQRNRVKRQRGVQKRENDREKMAILKN